MVDMRLDDIIFVLARPSEPGNTGAVCRVMKNMGLSHLRIAAPELPASPEALKRLLARAIHAANIWEKTEHFDSLRTSLADCAITVGTSRRRGKHRKSSTFTPGELAAFLKDKDGKAAIVFGNERTGLTGEELELCNIASHIPVDPEFPSINLSHAVQIYAYELYQTLGSTALDKPDAPVYPGSPMPVPGHWVPMNAAEIDKQVENISNALASVGFYKHPGREEQERFLRDLIARAGLSLNEGRYLGNIIAKAGRLGT